MFDTVVRHGRVGLCSGWEDCDIGITGGRIAALGHGLSGRQVLDAAGHWVLPGGVDAHCHLDQPDWGGAASADGFDSGSRAALCGGTTTIIPFAMPAPAMTMTEGVTRALALANGRSHVDYALHAVATPSTGHVGDQLPDLVARGVPSVKAFMTYDGFAVGDGLLLDLMQVARDAGAVVMVHAENDTIIRWMGDRLRRLGHTALRHHALAHSETAEREAIQRVAALAEVTGARVVIVHVSGCDGLDELARARARGIDLTGETCPQYVFLTAADLDRPLPEALRHVFSPPPRGPKAAEALWQALAAGELTLWSSDHSPCRLEDRFAPGAPPHFDRVVSGVPGLETRLPLLFSEGLLSGRLDLPRYLELAGAAAADLYGLPGKGRIGIGADADLVLWDPGHRWQILAAEEQSKTGYSPFEGRWLTGRPVAALLRGIPVLRDRRLAGTPPQGRFIPRPAADPTLFNPPLEETAPWNAH